MNSFAHAFASAVDGLLLVMVAATVALVLYKGLQLFWPSLLGRPSLMSQLGTNARSREQGLRRLERWLTTLSVIASTAPFIGLAGTVAHIIEALRGLGGGFADMALISGPIATALIATLLGLCSAVPALIASHFYWQRLSDLEIEHKLATDPT